ncbi:polyprenyl synthetase family protein [Trueperella bialowiezensis]|uniref:Octaprenyl-diphosphate synthase n=1 Tax=Trueperella bialowiezensis TaxID=312285 RepID=A0A448PFL1_9ACTO|nr:polyprenyl synthetase family protein [Trueperella bialowiezensis]VEI13712.1 Octaprenyl-diphosphate synthase [Trueperella bialowiezensis]
MSVAEFLSSDDPFARRISQRMAVVEDRLREQTRVDDVVADPVTSHLADAGGKRLRPLLTLLAAELGPNPDSSHVIDAAVVMELTHLASLYHDDVMDEAPMRRGVPTAQYIFGNSSAIMAGDVLFSRASKIVAGLGQKAIYMHANAFERLCMGQLHEIVGPREGEDPIEHHVAVLSGKTGSLIAAAAHHGVMAAGGSDEISHKLEQFGERIGVAFQIADDVIDLSDDELTGKTAGTDLLEGVPTYPTLLLNKREAEGELDAAGAEILAALRQGNLDEGDRLAAVVAALREHDVVAETRDVARSWVDDALTYLVGLDDYPVYDYLVAFAHGMVERMY